MDWIISLIIFIVIALAIFTFARSRRAKVQPPVNGGGSSNGGRKQDQV